MLLHWTIAACLIVVLATGLRIASDEAGLRWLTLLDGVLPRENLWYWHLIGALSFAALVAAYVTYILAARLSRRVALDATRRSTLLRPGPARWASAGVVLLWLFFGAAAVELSTGVLLLCGQAGWASALHRQAVWICLAFPFLHVAFHLAYGGLAQIARVFRPARLTQPPPEPDVLALLAEKIQMVEDLKRGQSADGGADQAEAPTRPSRTPPLLVATGAGLVIAAAGYALYWGTAQALTVPSTNEPPPRIDGDISEVAWSRAPMLAVTTNQGANFGGAGESLVEVRAVHDMHMIYFAFTWADPTRSSKYLPLAKDADGWRLLRSSPQEATEERMVDDKFSVLLSPPTVPLLGAAIHLSSQPIVDYPVSASGRGLHYTTPPAVVDVWVWRAAAGSLSSYLDDAHFAGPAAPTADQLAGKARYPGGYASDNGDTCVVDNYEERNLDGMPKVFPIRLPVSIDAATANLGTVDTSAEVSEAEDAKWWLSIEDSIPYSVEADTRLMEGTIIPNLIRVCEPSGGRADVKAAARWSAGRWTLEVSRELDTHSTEDVAITSGTMMWVSAFDHAATRHTRHIRAIRLQLD